MSTQKIKLMTYNIGFAAGLNGLEGAIHSKEKINQNLTTISTLITTHNPDILTIQEIDIHSKRSCFINQISYLKNQCHFPYSAIDITWNCRYVPYPISFNFNTHFGKIKAAQVVFSKYPIINHAKLLFNKPKKNPWWYNLFYLNRVAQFVTIQLPSNQKIEIVNVQCDAFHPTERETQIAHVVSQLKSLKHPHILCGDINAIPNSQQKSAPFSNNPKTNYTDTVIDTLSTEYKTTPHHMTYPANQPNRQLDYILVSKGLNRSSLEVLDINTIRTPNYPSDHLPLLAEIFFE
jgi:endonuclease/exonuclease/phosphatase family metal-dependent hydrolase